MANAATQEIPTGLVNENTATDFEADLSEVCGITKILMAKIGISLTSDSGMNVVKKFAQADFIW